MRKTREKLQNSAYMFNNMFNSSMYIYCIHMCTILLSQFRRYTNSLLQSNTKFCRLYSTLYIKSKNKAKRRPDNIKQLTIKVKEAERTLWNKKILRLTPEELIRVLQGKTIQLNCPADMELIDIKYDAFARQVTAVVRSDFFEDTVKGSPTPEFI